MKPEDQQPSNPAPMDEFEQSLARALRHVEVRAETTAKFLAIAAEMQPQRQPTGELIAFPRRFGWASGAIAAALLVGAFAGVDAHHRHQQRAAEQQFDTAMRVTDHALDHTRSQLERAGITLGD